MTFVLFWTKLVFSKAELLLFYDKISKKYKVKTREERATVFLIKCISFISFSLNFLIIAESQGRGNKTINYDENAFFFNVFFTVRKIVIVQKVVSKMAQNESIRLSTHN